ncbi:LysE/ArgO family amino acid transporter [Ferrimonas aestuarii]|uniref:Amino acid transporter n=1 Tax=Ferrimonas aestuarii TaxID=2569539 RepID=A0A4U1BP29_9GAMM|nr:LysE/ArgO family amino acid transporter [Ferrimonas aestuarii]TKB56145.1 amino acid transporter [Ferrimonas aestuarii]
MVSAYVNGLGVGAGLIMAIGAQGAFVLSQALKRQYHVMVALVCTLLDVILIGVGVAGLGALITESPALMQMAQYGGAAFLLWFGFTSLKRAIQGQEGMQAGEALASRRKVLLTTLAVTLLNPHVYLDAVVLLGSIGAQFGDGKWSFYAGTVTASFLWFMGLTFAAVKLSPWLSNPKVWRAIDALVWVMMWTIAARLLLS